MDQVVQVTLRLKPEGITGTATEVKGLSGATVQLGAAATQAAAGMVAAHQAAAAGIEKQVQALRLNVQAFDAARAAGASYAQAEAAVAAATAAASAASEKERQALRALAAEHRQLASAVAARHAQARADQELNGAGGLQRQIALLREVTQGTRSLADAERLLAIERARASGLTIGQAGRLVAAREEAAALQATITAGQQATPVLTALAAAKEQAALQAQAYAQRLGPLGVGLAALGPGGVAATAGILGLGKVLVDGVRFGRAFEAQLADLRAIVSVSGEDLAFLSERALELARTTGVSAIDVVQSFKLIASAKSELLSSAEALSEVTEQAIILSQASGIALPEAASALVNTLNQLKLSASEASDVVNVLAAGSRFGAAEVDYLNEAIIKSGTAAGAAGLTIEELVSAIELIAESGAPAEIAGTALSAVFAKLAGRLGDTNIKSVGLTHTLRELAQKGFGDLTVASEALDSRQAVFLSLLVQGAERQAQLQAQVTGTTTALDQQAIRMDTLNGSLERLGGTYETLLAKIGNSKGLIRDLVDLGDGLLGFLGQLDGYKVLFGIVAAGLAAWAAPAVAAATGIGLVASAAATAGGIFVSLSGIQRTLTEYFAQAAPVIGDVRNNLVQLHNPVNDLVGLERALYDIANPVNVALNAQAGEMVTLTGAARNAAGAVSELGAEEQRLRENRKRATETARDTVTRLRAEVGAVDALGPKATPAQVQGALASARVRADTGGESDETKKLADEIGRLTQRRKEQDDAINANARSVRSLGKDQANAVQQAKEQVAELRAEVAAREAASAAGLTVAETEAKVAGAKTLVKTGSEALAAAAEAETLALKKLNEQNDRLKSGEGAAKSLRDQTTALLAQVAAFDETRASGGSYLQMQEAMAVAAKEAEAGNKQQAATLRDVATANQAAARGHRERLAILQATEEIDAPGGLRNELDLLRQVTAGTLSLVEAERKLAVQREVARGLPLVDAEQLVALRDEVKKTQAVLEASTINLADSFDRVIDGFVDGMLSGTRKSLDAGKLLTDGFKSLFADAFKATIHSKFQFLDQPLSVNLLRDIPAMASQGAGAIVSLFGAAFGKVGSMASSVLGIIGSLFSGGGGGGQRGGGGFGTAVGTILSGISGVGSLFSGASSIGQAATTAGNVAQLGSAVASGNVGSMVSNTSTMVSLLRGIYNGFSAWTGGASLGGSLNAAFGGILTPLASSITGALGLGGAGGSAVASIAPGFVGFSDAALGAAVVAEGASSSTGAVGISAGTAGGSIAGAASTAGILAAVVAAIEAFLGLSAVEENRKSAFSTADTRKMFMSTFDPFTLAIANFTAMLAGMGSFGGLGNNPGGGSGASNLFGVIQGTMFGGASGLDIAKLAGALAGPLGPMLLPLFAFAAFTKPPSGGTATRVAFEGFLEEKNRKHESRRFAPFFGNVPVLQDGEFLKGNFDRSLGQDFARDFEKRGQGSFSDGLREYIRLQGESIGLGKAQIAQFTALGFAFKATVLGDKGGSQEQRNLATIAAMLGSMAEGGANAVTAMELLRISIGKLGDPAKVFDDLGDALKGGKIAAEDYRAVIQALADLYAGPAPTIKFDLSDKNQKGLDVYKEEIEAINAVFQDLPPGVHAGVRALELLDQTLTDAGEQGVVTFEALNERLQQAVRSVELLNPLVANFRQTIEQGAAEAIKNGTQEQLLDDAVDAFVLSAGRKIQDMVTSSIVEGFLRAQIDTGALAGFFDTVDKAFKEFQAGPQDATALDALTDTLQGAGLAAVATIETLTPALRQLGLAIFNIGEAFDAALDVTTSSTTDAIGLATAVVQLDAAHRQFQNDIDARIFALRNQGKASPEILKRDLPDIAKEFQLTQLGFFGSLSDVIRAGQSGLINPDEIETYLRRTPGGPDEPTSAEKAAALVTLKDLAEKDLAIRIAAIQAETAAVIEGHQERIADLQEERAAIQEASQAAIEARQEELELIQESIAKMQAWKGLLDTTQDTLLTLRGQFESPQQQLGNLRERFEKALVDFNTIDTAHPDFSDEQRIAAGQKLNELGPQLLQLAQQSGLAQSSEAYRILYDLVTDALDRVAGVAGSESAGLLDKQQQALDLQREIRDLQKDAAAQLKAIDEQIEAEQDAIVAAQKDAEAKIQKVSENTAGVLEWIRNQEKALYEAQHAELMAKLDAAGVTSVNLEDIQASSLLELQAIRAVLEGKGIAVDATNSAGGSASTGGNAGATPGSGGAAGSTSPGGQAERGTGGTSGRYDISPTDLATWRGLTEQAAARPGTTAFENHLLAMVGRGFDDVSSTGIMGRAFWRGARSRDAQNAVIDATLKKIYDLATVSPILGFATGGLVRGDRIARVGEAGPELILPLGAALRDREVRRTFEDFFTAATAVPYGDIQRQLRELAGVATFGGGTRAGLLDTLRTLAPTVPLAPAAPVAAPAAPVQIIQNFELNLTLKVDGATRLDNPAEAVRKLTPELKRALLELLASDATVKAASARASRQAQPPARNS